MEKATLEVIRELKDRFKYPIITIYIVVLILWNWDVLSYYFLSDSKIENKINYIENHFNQNWSRILFPLLKAILLAIIIPSIMLGIEYILQIINVPRRKIKFKNNEDIRNEKLAIAMHEFKVEQERTGKKTVEEWEEKVRSLEQKLDLQKLDNISLENEKFDLDKINNGFLDELKNKNLQIEKQQDNLEIYQKYYQNVINEVTDGSKSNLLNVHKFIVKIHSIEDNGLIIFNEDLNDEDFIIIDGFIEFAILDKENRKYYARALGVPFIHYCKTKFRTATLNQL